MRWGIAVLSLLGLFGCARGERDFIIGDESFTADERAAIEEGAAFISKATGHQVPDIVWGPLPMWSEDMTIQRTAMPLHVLGDCEEGHFSVRLDTLQEPARNAEAAAHEFGHALGLEHLAADVPGLMNPNASPRFAWTEADEQSCVALGVCQR